MGLGHEKIYRRNKQVYLNTNRAICSRIIHYLSEFLGNVPKPTSSLFCIKYVKV